jgi:ATP-dependent DNA helicase RecQ
LNKKEGEQNQTEVVLNLFQKALKVLQDQFGFTNLRGPQEEVIRAVLAGESILSLMPTGMGKSLCYQLPAVTKGGLTLVISPLIALMHDQVQKNKEKGISSTYLSATLSKEEREERLHKVRDGKINILYVTPERFKRPEFKAIITQQKIELLAIDEAHCISHWGHDFRPDYSRLGEIKKMLGDPPVIALTASATPEVQKDICEQLEIPEKNVISTGIQRDNLNLFVEESYGLEEKVERVLKFYEELQGNVIVYFTLISTLEKAAEIIKKKSINFTCYHGDLKSGDRRKNQNLFLKADRMLMLATPAFGLGVDKQDIRGVVHFEMPGSLESYYQEVGRAGRDGLSSKTLLLYDEDDISTQMEFIKWSHPEPDFILGVYRLIEKGESELHGEGMLYLRKKLNFYNTRDYRVETSVNLMERWGFLEETSTGFGYKAVELPEGEILNKQKILEEMKHQQKKLLQMVQFCKMESGCRWYELFKYFGHASNQQECGHCDLCLS